MENFKQEKLFDWEKSPMKGLYTLLDAKTPLELSNNYTKEDQKLMKSREWDYKNADLLMNKAKEQIESINENSLTEEEKYWRNQILWLWYHHAISWAIAKYRDKEAAKLFTNQALQYQPEDHPNQITRLFYFLLHDKFDEAESLAQSIEEEPEKSTSRQLIEEYKQVEFL